MHILVISDAYPPIRTSCANQIFDLAQAFLLQGHCVSIIIPSPSQAVPVEISNVDGPTIYRVRCFQTKDVNYIRRTAAEFFNPLIIGFYLTRNNLFFKQKIEGIVWYSPSIFWGPLVRVLKTQFGCKAYLILRDIFPDWAVDLKIINSKLIYLLLKRVEQHQYRQANWIGVQSPGNIEYLLSKNPSFNAEIEVLWNWAESIDNKVACDIDISTSSLAGRKIFIYAGNVGLAQGLDVLFELITSLSQDSRYGFVFVGRGSELERFKAMAALLRLQNILFFDEIPSLSVNSLYDQCDVGLISLNLNHKSHNIPGKFISYMKAGLPVYAVTSKSGDLAKLIFKKSAGVAVDSTDISDLKNAFYRLVKNIDDKKHTSLNCKKIFLEYFTSEVAAKKIAQKFLVS